MKIQEMRHVLSLSVPLMTAFFSQKIIQFIDTIMLGWIGIDALVAGIFATSIFFTTLIFCSGILSSVGVYISQAKGGNNSCEIKVRLQHGFYLSLLLSFPCMLIVWVSPYFLIFMGKNIKIVKNVVLLTHGLAWGIPGYLFFLTMREFTSAFGFTKVVMMISLVSIPLAFITNYFFIYGKFLFPKLSISGIGYSGSVIMWFMFLFLIIYCKYDQLLRTYMSFNLKIFSYKKILEMLALGFPSGILFVLEASMFFSAVIMMGYFGENNLAAYQIAMQCASIAYSIPFALSMTTALLVGHAVGSIDVKSIKNSIFYCLSLALFFSMIVSVIFLIFPEFLSIFFLKSSNKEIIQLVSVFLTIAALFQSIDAIQAIVNGALRGMKDTFTPMLISIGCYWVVGMSSAYYFSFHTNLGARGVWYGLTLGFFSAAGLLLLRLLKKLSSINMNYGAPFSPTNS